MAEELEIVQTEEDFPEIAFSDEEMDEEALEAENAEVCFSECEEEKCCEDEEEDVTDEEIENSEALFQTAAPEDFIPVPADSAFALQQ